MEPEARPSKPEVAQKSYRAALQQAETPADLAQLFLAERARLKEVNQAQPQGLRGCRALTEVSDLLIQRLLNLALPPPGPARDATKPRVSIVATGGYGRRELCPYSDIDVTFVVAEEEDADLDSTVRNMFLLLMETFSQRSGLKVGYAYRALGDVAQLDHQTLTSLLDTRVIAGSHGLSERFVQKVLRSIWPAAFVRQKVAERLLLAEKHGGTIYRIEPEVREGLGGLRDLHLAEWLAAVSFPQTRGDVWRQLQRLGAVTRREVQDLTAAREFLLTVRAWMHWHTDRKAEILVRERQDLLAEALKLEDTPELSCVERLMETYYRHAESISRITSSVIDRCLSERLSLSDELACAGNEIVPAYPWVEVSSPHFLVELCRQYQEHGLAPGYELRRVVAQHIEKCPDLSTDIAAAEDFVGLLQTPPPDKRARETGAPGVYDTLKLMADMGVLQRLIPELGRAYLRVPFDQIHKHTIGHHSLEVVKSLEALRVSEDEALRDFVGIWTQVQAPELLFLAGMLHDVGKLGAGDHSESGAGVARDICARLRLDGSATARVETLVRHHLLMSDTAQLRDLNMEETIQQFTQVIDSPDLLNMLLLLTYADMEATGVLTPVRVRFLQDLYFRAEALLTQVGKSPMEDPDRARRFRSRLSRRLSSSSLTQEQIKEHTEGMPVAYLLNTRPEQIALHIRMVETLRNSQQAVVEFDNDMGSEVTTIYLCTLDRPEPGLLCEIAGVLYAHEISVHAAQVYTSGASDSAIALDTLYADYHGRGIPPLKRLELEQDLVNVLRDGGVEDLIAKMGKTLPAPIPPWQVTLDNGATDRHTIVQLETEDQPALLYRAARAMATLGWNIHSARISTIGTRVRDAFYVTARDAGKLPDEAGLVESFDAEFAR